MDQKIKADDTELLHFALDSLLIGNSPETVVTQLKNRLVPSDRAQNIVAKAVRMKPLARRSSGSTSLVIGLAMLALGMALLCGSLLFSWFSGYIIIPTGLIVGGLLAVSKGLLDMYVFR